MSSVDSVLDDFDDEEVYYDPHMSNLVAEGSYPATIVDLTSKKINTRRGNKAMLYKPVYRIDDTVPNYAGNEIRDVGVWRFLGTKDPSGVRITGGSNTGYKRFLDKFSILSSISFSSISNLLIYFTNNVSGSVPSAADTFTTVATRPVVPPVKVTPL